MADTSDASAGEIETAHRIPERDVRPAQRGRYRPLICLALLHTVVDSFAMLNEPLWPRLTTELRLSEAGLQALLAVKLLTLNFSQGVFGYLRDRKQARYLLWLGPLVGVIGLSLMGASAAVPAVCAALCLGMIGTGAFHPEAVVVAGRALPEQRTRGVSLFLFGGTLGLGIGPLVGGYLVNHHGLDALPWLLAPGVMLVLGLYALSGLGRPELHAVRGGPAATLAEMLAGRGRLALFLLAVSAFRVVPNIGMTQAIAFSLDAHGADPQQIGAAQSLFLIAGSAGMLLMAAWFPRGWERPSLLLAPLAGLPLVLLLGLLELPLPARMGLWFLTGLVLNGTTPVMISYGHQLFPNGAGLASALTMGLSWGLGGLLVAWGTGAAVAAGHPEWLYLLFAPCLLIAVVGTWFLPDAHHPPSHSK